MKLSNKLLIVFAASLIVLPLLGMIYHAQVYYKTGAYSDDQKVRAENDGHFDRPSANMVGKAMSPYNSVNIADAKDRDIEIQFIKDDKFGVKIPTELKDSIDFKIDANGQMQIALKSKTSWKNSYTRILIYGPTVNKLTINRASTVFLNANSDSLSLQVKSSAFVQLQRDLKLNFLTITTDQVKTVEVEDVNFKSLNLNLNGTDFQSARSSYDQLSIKATGKSEIEIVGSDLEKDKSYLIKNLVINTIDAADFKLLSIKVDQCSGSFSDQTKVQMPVVNLKQMFTVKK